MGDRGVWDSARARKANRRWVWIAVGMSLPALLLLSAGLWVPYAWTLTMWNSQRVDARTADYDVIEPGTAYDEVVLELGPVSYEAPGFSRDGEIDAAVCVWQNTDAGEVRGMFINGRLVGSLLVFE